MDTSYGIALHELARGVQGGARRMYVSVIVLA